VNKIKFRKNPRSPLKTLYKLKYLTLTSKSVRNSTKYFNDNNSVQNLKKKLFKKKLLNTTRGKIKKEKDQYNLKIFQHIKLNNFFFSHLEISIKEFTERNFHIGCKKKARNTLLEYVYGRYSSITKYSIINLNYSFNKS